MLTFCLVRDDVLLDINAMGRVYLIN